MNNVIEIRRLADHELCRQCPHDEHCSSVCIAVETLVQLCKVKNPAKQLEYVYNAGIQLDLESSYDGIPDEQR